MQNIFALSFLWKHIKPYKWHYLVMVCAPIIGAFYPFAYNYAIKLFLDGMEKTQKLAYGDFLYPIILFLVAQFTLELVWRISNIAEWKAEPYVRRSILVEAYDYVQYHSYKYFQDNFGGAISSKIKGILDGYDKFWAEFHHGLFSRLIKTIINLCALSLVSLNLALFVFVWCLVYVPLMYSLSTKLNVLAFQETESRHTLIGQIADKITNIISLFSFSSRKRELESLDKQICKDFIPKQIKFYHYNLKFQIVGGILYLIMFSFILFYMVHLRIMGTITIGDFAFVFGITLVATEDIWNATISMQDFARSMGDFKSALTILQIPHENKDNPHAKPLIVKSPQIEFKNIHFSYNENKSVFNNLNIVIKPGEKVGLVGQSGAGKSSIINLLLRYFSPSSGTILIDGQDISTVTQDSLREYIAVIPQDTLLFHRSLYENISYGKPNASKESVIAASQKAHVHEFIEQLPEHYDSFVGERGIKLSGGQRQRIAIARAILKDAPILILDEATSSLDSHTEHLIQEGLNALIEDQKKTVIAIAHRLSTLKHMNRIIVLDKGEIIEEGTHDSLLAQKDSLYKKLWDLQKSHA